ncbi:hypothetical protein R2C4_00925 (plasmid) [Leisingera aquaemixtae]|nr:hypothetical protein R2C4_00925 [Leisingera aquaemixtae]
MVAPVTQTGSGTGAIARIKVTTVAGSENKWLRPATSNMPPPLPIRVATPSQAFADKPAHIRLDKIRVPFLPKG